MKSSHESPKADGAELDLPDWSGMEDSGLKVDRALAVRLCEEYYARLPEKARRYLEEQRSKQTYIEFEL
jgi:hypothetical protein